MLPLDPGCLARDRIDELRREAARVRLARRAAREPGPGPEGAVPGPPRPLGPQGRWGSPRGRLLGDGLAVGVSVVGFGLAYGMAARSAGFSLLELEAMNLLVFAGGSQLLTIGMLGAGLPWVWIVAFTALLNARHLLYGATLAPWFAGRPLRQKLLAAYVIVDESFALAMSHFRRLGRFDAGGYVLIAVMLATAWLGSTWLGWASSSSLPASIQASIQALAPAAVAGMVVLLVTDRQTLLAAVVAVMVGSAVAVAMTPAVGILAGAVSGVLAASVTPALEPPRTHHLMAP